MTTPDRPWKIGAIIAGVVLLVVLVMAMVGRMEWPIAGLLAALAVARLT